MRLNKLDYFDAIQASLENAKELIEEAEILVNHDKIARAYTLFQFSIEEVGKASLIFNFVLRGDIENIVEINSFKKSFRSHTTKTKISQGIDLIFALMSEKSDLTKKILENWFVERDKVLISNDYKNYSLYTSLIANKFLKPSEIITKEKLDHIAYFAKLRLQIADPFFRLGIENFDAIYEHRDNFNKEEVFSEGAKKIKEILE